MGAAAAGGFTFGGAAIGSATAGDSIQVRAIPIHHFVRAYEDDDPGSPIPDPQDRLVERAEGNPIDDGDEVYDLDGRWIRWGEFSAVEGVADIEDQNGDTDVSLRMTGLIPEVQYTMWVIVFEDPGFEDVRNLTEALEHMAGFGPLGEQDGSENAFRPRGSVAKLDVTHEPGELSVGGYEVKGSLLDEYEVHVASAIHLDGETHGGLPGPDDGTGAPTPGYWTEQSGFVFGSGL